jgi:hypothetical protein
MELTQFLEKTDAIYIKQDGRPSRRVELSSLADLEEESVPAFFEAIGHALIQFRTSLVNSSDAVVKFTSQFLNLGELFFDYESSVHRKDSVARESYMSLLILYFSAAYKTKYVIVAASSMETFYRDMSAQDFQNLRGNRDHRSNEGKNAVDMDKLNEEVNDYDKKMECSQSPQTHIKSHFFSAF